MMTDGKTIMNVTDVLAVCTSIIESANNEVIYISPPSLLVLGSQFSIDEKTKMLIQRGGTRAGYS